MWDDQLISETSTNEWRCLKLGYPKFDDESSFSHHFPSIFPMNMAMFVGLPPVFFWQNPGPGRPMILGGRHARHLDLRYCGLQGEAQSAHIASILQATTGGDL